MLQENVEILRRANEAFNRGDVGRFLEFCGEDVEVKDLNNAPDLPPVARGRQAVREMLEAWLGAFEELIGEIEEYIDTDDRHVACLVRYRGKMRDSASQVDFRAVDVWGFCGNELVRGTLGYPDRESALQALAR